MYSTLFYLCFWLEKACFTLGQVQKYLFIPVLTLWFWVCSVFLSLPHVRFLPSPRTKWFLKTATMSCWRRMLIWSLVDYSSAEPLMPPGTNVLLSKQQLSDKIAFWFCDLLFREWIWMLLCWRSRWLWSKLLSGRLEVESSFAHSSCLESHNALFSIFGRRCVRS